MNTRDYHYYDENYHVKSLRQELIHQRIPHVTVPRKINGWLVRKEYLIYLAMCWDLTYASAHAPNVPQNWKNAYWLRPAPVSASTGQDEDDEDDEGCENAEADEHSHEHEGHDDEDSTEYAKANNNSNAWIHHNDLRSRTQGIASQSTDFENDQSEPVLDEHHVDYTDFHKYAEDIEVFLGRHDERGYPTLEDIVRVYGEDLALDSFAAHDQVDEEDDELRINEEFNSDMREDAAFKKSWEEFINEDAIAEGNQVCGHASAFGKRATSGSNYLRADYNLSSCGNSTTLCFSPLHEDLAQRQREAEVACICLL